MIYVGLILSALLLIAWELFGKRKRKLRVSRKGRLELNISFVEKIDEWLRAVPILHRLKEKYVMKLSVVNTYKRSHNNALSIGFLIMSVVVVLMLSFMLFKVMNLWYVILVIALLILYLMHYGFATYLNYKLKRVYEQFPVAIQMFTDIYITNKSIKNALTDSYVDMPKDVGLVFERLARKLSSGHEYDKYIHEFADSLSYVWGYAFAELLLMSYEGSGDISNDLLFLNELMNDDLQDEEESKAEMTTNKTLFMVLNLITVIVFVGNIFFSPIAKELYFYTTTGNTIIMSWLMLIAFGISVSTIMENI